MYSSGLARCKPTLPVPLDPSTPWSVTNLVVKGGVFSCGRGREFKIAKIKENSDCETSVILKRTATKEGHRVHFPPHLGTQELRNCDHTPKYNTKLKPNVCRQPNRKSGPRHAHRHENARAQQEVSYLTQLCVDSEFVFKIV